MAYGDVKQQSLVEPIKRLLQKDDSPSMQVMTGINTKKETIVDQHMKQNLDEFGGYGIELIYDSEDNLIQVNSNSEETKLIYSPENIDELDHVETRVPNQDSPYLRTNLDYTPDEDRLLKHVYTELVVED